jgi:hypothetical protein
MDAVIQTMASNNNGLKESCDSATATSNNCNSDQQTFKGILMMYMAWFLQVTGRDSNGKYADFVKNQGDKIMAVCILHCHLWKCVSCFADSRMLSDPLDFIPTSGTPRIKAVPSGTCRLKAPHWAALLLLRCRAAR